MELPGNGQDLIRGFAALLTAIEQANQVLAQGDKSSNQGQNFPSVPNILENIRDTFTSYEEKELSDGRLLRRYENGAVRILNPKSGVVQEERINGNLLISLPTGRVVFQEQPGYPLLVFNSVDGGTPVLGKVVMVQLGQNSEARPAFQFDDQDGSHFIDMESLRYVKVKENANHIARTQAETQRQLLPQAA